MFYEEIRIKQGPSYIPFCPFRILYNSKKKKKINKKIKIKVKKVVAPKLVKLDFKMLNGVFLKTLITKDNKTHAWR